MTVSRPKRPTYRELILVLEHLGFQDESVPGSHHAFRHRASETLILFADLDPEDAVRREDLISVCRHLDSRGLMDAREFERQFPQAPAAETQ